MRNIASTACRRKQILLRIKQRAATACAPALIGDSPTKGTKEDATGTACRPGIQDKAAKSAPLFAFHICFLTPVAANIPNPQQWERLHRRILDIVKHINFRRAAVHIDKPAANSDQHYASFTCASSSHMKVPTSPCMACEDL
jgi:hypothetical protein